METQKTKNISRRIYADKLCLAAIVSFLIGICLNFLCLLLNSFDQIQWLSPDAFAIGGWLMLMPVFFIVPFLALAAIINILTNWRAVTNPDDGQRNQDLLCKTSYYFLITSILFLLVSLFFITLGIINGSLRNASLADLEGIWFIMMLLMALVMGLISYKFFAKASAPLLPRVSAIFAIVLSLVALVVLFLSTNHDNYFIQRYDYSSMVETFSGKSSFLKQTSIIPKLDSMDVLIVPEMFWEIAHDFDELLGKIVANANPAMPIIEAKQGIKFKLDSCGAMLESEATIMTASIPRYFIFNRPFLIYMKKRDCEQPFFVMWVDNAELLNRTESS